jgi:hypothetical protein
MAYQWQHMVLDLACMAGVFLPHLLSCTTGWPGILDCQETTGRMALTGIQGSTDLSRTYMLMGTQDYPDTKGTQEARENPDSTDSICRLASMDSPPLLGLMGVPQLIPRQFCAILRFNLIYIKTVLNLILFILILFTHPPFSIISNRPTNGSGVLLVFLDSEKTVNQCNYDVNIIQQSSKVSICIAISSMQKVK